jgi:hypothetical protein
VPQGTGRRQEPGERLPWFVYAIPLVLLAFIVIYAIVASWIPAT